MPANEDAGAQLTHNGIHDQGALSIAYSDPPPPRIISNVAGPAQVHPLHNMHLQPNAERIEHIQEQLGDNMVVHI